MAVKVGMHVRVNHPEVNPEHEWLVHEVVDAISGGEFYHLKGTGQLVQWLMLPSYVEFDIFDHSLPPVLSPEQPPMPAGDSYHQDRKLVKRILDGFYCTKLQEPNTEYKRTKVAADSWAKSIKKEQDRNIGLFMTDLKIVCGTRSRQIPGTKGGGYGATTNAAGFSFAIPREGDGFGQDYQEAVKMWEETSSNLDYSSWVTFLGIYASYRKVIES